MRSPLLFASSLLAYCSATGASVTSWGRTRAHNAAVGGVRKSQHLAWLAADVVYDAPIPLADRQTLAALLELRLIAEGDHDHLQTLP